MMVVVCRARQALGQVGFCAVICVPAQEPDLQRWLVRVFKLICLEFGCYNTVGQKYFVVPNCPTVIDKF
jgi:hypothetical protein